MLNDKNVTVYYQDSILDRIFHKWHPIDVSRFTIEKYVNNNYTDIENYLYTSTKIDILNPWNNKDIFVSYYNYTLWKWKSRFKIDGKIYQIIKQNIDFINHNIEILKSLSNLEE